MDSGSLASIVALLLAATSVACGSNVSLDGAMGTKGGPAGGGAGGAGTTGSSGGSGASSAGGTGATGTIGTTGTTATTSTTSTTGTGSGAGGGIVGADAGEVCPSFGDSCTACLSTSCPAVYCGCSQNPACIDLLKCSGTCGGDKACIQACYAADQDGIAAAVLASDCAGTLCNAACSWGGPIGGCQACIATDCAKPYNACIAMAECVALYQCLKGCKGADLVCQKGCYAAHGDAVPTLQALLDCSGSACAAPCK